MIHALLALAPITVLLGLLARGHYPGEAAIAAARDRRSRPVAPPRRFAAGVLVVLPLRILLPRGGALLARRLAGRAPPPAWSAPT